MLEFVLATLLVIFVTVIISAKANYKLKKYAPGVQRHLSPNNHRTNRTNLNHTCTCCNHQNGE